MLFSEKIVDNKELMECIKGDPLIYISSSKDFKITRKKKIQGKKYLLHWKLDIISAQTRYNMYYQN